MDDREYLKSAAEYFLKTDGVNEPEHDVFLDIGIATGEDAAVSASKDYSVILLFLRKLVNSGNTVSVEQILQTLAQLDTVSISSDRTVTCSHCISAHPMGHASTPHLRLTISAKVGTARHDWHEQVPEGQAEGDVAAHTNSSSTECQPSIELDVQSSISVSRHIYAPPDVEELVNSDCDGGEQYRRSTLLYCAILTGNEDMVKCLLRWGADPTLMLERVRGDRKHGDWKHSPISVAASLLHTGIVKCLLAYGASPHQGAVFLGECMWGFGPLSVSTYGACREDADTCAALCQHPGYPPPMAEVWKALVAGDEGIARMMMARCRWDAACARRYLAFDLWKTPMCEKLLDTPCVTDTDLMCKQFCCYLILRSFCTSNVFCDGYGDADSPVPPFDANKLKAIVQHLLQLGAEPAGLSASQSKVLCDHWLKVENAEAAIEGSRPVKFDNRTALRFAHGGCFSYSRPPAPVHVLAPCVSDAAREQLRQLLPPETRYLSTKSAAAYFSYGICPVVDRLLFARSVEDPVVQLLVQHGGLPGISTVDEIPFVDGYLHDGPACQCDHVRLTAAQEKTSVFDVVTPSPQPKSLAHYCRSAVIAACQGYGVSKAITSLGLPHVLTKYLLFQ
eukprot:scpid41245/ scgid22716/ 